MSNFAFLQPEWPQVYEAAVKAEQLVQPDARAACFYARRALELAIKWLYTHDPEFKSPYDTNLSALLHAPSFQVAAGQTVFAKAKLVIKLGNHAVHSHKQVQQSDALNAIRELFHILFWLARTYSKSGKPVDTLQFDAAALPKTSPSSCGSPIFCSPSLIAAPTLRPRRWRSAARRPAQQIEARPTRLTWRLHARSAGRCDRLGGWWSHARPFGLR